MLVVQGREAEAVLVVEVIPMEALASEAIRGSVAGRVIRALLWQGRLVLDHSGCEASRGAVADPEGRLLLAAAGLGDR